LIGCTLLDEPEFQRFYCKKRLATEIQGTVKNAIFQHDDLLLAQRQHHDDTLETTLLITEFQRSVLHTLGNNNNRHPIAYSPYGHRIAESGLTSLLGFNGERVDLVTGHYLLGNGRRAFNPVLMRFNGPDSFSPFEKGGVNAYAYCLGDPVNRGDPTGNFSVLSWLAKQVGLKSTLLSLDLQTRRGVPAAIGKRAHRRVSELNHKIAEVAVNVQREVFSEDNFILNPANSFSRPQKAGIQARKFQEPFADVLLRTTESDQANYRKLFDHLDRWADYNQRLTDTLSYAEGKGVDLEVIKTYRARLQSATSQEIAKLEKKRSRIRERYLRGG
jgi:RHS repeat-associated protein